MITAAASVPLSAQLTATPAVADDAIADLIKGAEMKNAAFMRGEMDRWASLTRIASDFTLMQPFGGPASHGFDTSPEKLKELGRYFRNGTTKLEVAQTYGSHDLVVLVMIERQRAEVGGLPGQDWSLRVTEVYRKDGLQWQLVHRHADPLVHRVDLAQAAALARGQTQSECSYPLHGGAMYRHLTAALRLARASLVSGAREPQFGAVADVRIAACDPQLTDDLLPDIDGRAAITTSLPMVWQAARVGFFDYVR